MADLLDEVHAQSQGDLLDQVHAQTQGGTKTIGGFASNLLSSGGKLIGDAASAVMHPLDTLSAIGAIPVGLAEKAGLPVPAAKPGEADSAKMLDAMVDHFKQRYGSLEGVKNALYQDPAGVAMDVSMLAGGAGAGFKALSTGAKAADLGRVASLAGKAGEVARTVESVANPVNVAMKTAGLPLRAAWSKAATKTADTIESAPRPLSPGAIAIAKKLDIPLTQGAEGGSRFTQAVEKTLGNTVAPDLYEKVATKGQEGISQGLNQLASNFRTDHFAAGDATVNQLLEHSSEAEHAARDSYSALAKFEADPANIQDIVKGEKTTTSTILDAQGKPTVTTTPITEKMGLPVDVQSWKTALQPIRDRIMRQLPFARQQYSPGLHAIQNILDGPDAVPASVAEENLSALKAIQREAVDGKTKALAGAAIHAANPSIESAVAEAGPEATKALLDGRAAWKEHAQTLDLIDSIAKDATGKTEQTNVARKLLAPADATYPQLMQVLEKAPNAREPLAQALMSKVFAKAETGTLPPTQAKNLWNQVGKRTKNALFDQQHIDDVNSTLELAQRLAENPNASNTGVINGLLKAAVFITHPTPAGIAGWVAGRKLAQVLISREGASSLRSLLQNPTGPNAGQSLSIVQRLATSSKVARAGEVQDVLNAQSQ